MEKYFKIGEISDLYNIGVDSLRYYEKLGIITPKRAESGYRLYNINDIWKLNVIRDLRELGLDMKQIKKYLNCHNVSSTLELLKEEENIINSKIQALKKLQKNVEKRRKTILDAENLELNKIELTVQKPRKCFSITQGYSNEHEMDVLIKRLLNFDKNNFYVIGNNQIGTTISLKEAKEKGKLKYQSVFIIDEKGKEYIKEGKYLSVSYKGDYSQSKKWTQKLLSYAEKENLKPLGDILEILWIDIHSSEDINEHITELQLPVE